MDVVTLAAKYDQLSVVSKNGEPLAKIVVITQTTPYLQVQTFNPDTGDTLSPQMTPLDAKEVADKVVDLKDSETLVAKFSAAIDAALAAAKPV